VDAISSAKIHGLSTSSKVVVLVAKIVAVAQDVLVVGNADRATDC
jgi:hypothetical protein